MKFCILFLKLIRWPNLVIIFLTQWLFQYCVITPLLRASGLEPKMSVAEFLMISAAYMLVAAAGYVINDYFDLGIDTVNKPEKVFITRGISRNGAIAAYGLMNAAAAGLAWVVSVDLGGWAPLYCILGCIVLLYCYSAFFKKRFLIGNILVAGISASAMPVLTLVEGDAAGIFPETLRYITIYTFLYTGFAFIISFARELVKDLEDVEGDRRYGGRTMPIVLGARTAHWIVAGSLISVIGVLAALQPFLWTQQDGGTSMLSVYSICLIILPLAWILRKVFGARAVQDYHRLSTWIKIVMLTGILSMLFIQFMIL